jgi:hypothetical protein
MVRSAATSVEAFISELPADRRQVVTEVRDLIRRNIPNGYEETVNWGMLCYQIPLERYPNTYNGQPLGYVALAAQKNYCALYLMSASSDPAQGEALRDGFAKAGKKLDIGKSCLRFKTTDDLALDAVAKLIAATPPEKFIEIHEASRPAKPAKKPKASRR